MAQRAEIVAVYAAGLVQGVALVTFPAASAVFTSPSAYGLSSTEYGGMFVPQALAAVLASVLGAGMRSRLGTKRIYFLGLCADLLAMSLLVASRFSMQQHAAAFGMLLAATTALGAGFGFTVPSLNTLAAAFFPRTAERAVLGLNALLGLGTALAPLFVLLFVGLGFWWGLPLLVGASIVALLLFSLRLPLIEGTGGADQHTLDGGRLPTRFWAFALFTLLYGVCETMNGNWCALYMQQHFGASASLSSLALTIFWSTITAGRLLFAALESRVSGVLVCRTLPLVLILALLASAGGPTTSPWLGIATFALAGLGCSALLPLSISFGQQELTTISASVAGGLIASYQIGYGIAAFGAGPLQNWAGLRLSGIYAGAAIVALALWRLSFAIARRQ